MRSFLHLPFGKMPEISFFYAPYICIEEHGNNKAIAVGGTKLSVSEAGGDT